MGRYRWQARDANGIMLSGVLSAPGVEEARQNVKQLGLELDSLESEEDSGLIVPPTQQLSPDEGLIVPPTQLLKPEEPVLVVPPTQQMPEEPVLIVPPTQQLVEETQAVIIPESFQADETHSVPRLDGESPTSRISVGDGDSTKVRRPADGDSTRIRRAPVRTTIPTVKGTRPARSRAELAVPAPAPPRPRAVWLKWQPIPATARIVLFDELSVMLKSGLPITRAMEVLAAQQTSDRLRSVLERVLHELSSGQSLSSAMLLFPHVFPAVEVATVTAGETSGQLPGLLERLSRLEAAQYARIQRLRSALTYPSIVFATVLVVVGVLSQFLFGHVVESLAGAGLEMPPITQALLGVSRVVGNPLCWLAVVAGGTWLGSALPRDFAERIPVLRGVLQKMALASFCQSLALLYDGGVGIRQALELAGDVCGSVRLRAASVRVRERVTNGKPIGDAMQAEPLFGRLVPGMVRVGEEVAALPRVLEASARTLEQDAETALAACIALLEPILMACLGILVAAILLAAFAPIYSILWKLGL